MRNVYALIASLLIVTGATTTQVRGECVAPLDSLVSLWTGEIDGTDSVSGHHATFIGQARAGVPALIGNGFELDGAGDGLTISGVLVAAMGTLEGWLRPTTSLLTNIHGVFGTFSPNSWDRLWFNFRGPLGGLGVGPNTWVVNVSDNNVDQITIPDTHIPLDTWKHVSVTWAYESDQARVTLYVNGTSIGQFNGTRAAPRVIPPTGDITLGWNGSTWGQNFYFVGLMDELALYDDELTAAEVQAIFQAGASGKCTGMSVGERLTVLEGHTHTYLTGEGGGHNAIEASTSGPE